MTASGTIRWRSATGAPECELRGETDHAVLRLALKATEKDGYWWVQCSACDSGWQVPYHAESVG
jgi:hypothetical protein